ncbi:MAG: (2Fe-2S)-binding protein [Candidatus Binatia bacterium]
MPEGRGLFSLRFQLNGRSVESECEAQETLAELLRNRLNLNGTKVSCEVQVCGACTVLLDGLPVSACTLLAYEVRDRNVLTVEGLARPDGTLHPIQQAFIEEFAFQCGFCTPGMLMAAKALLTEQPSPTEADIIHFMDGNICRCTGYLPIVRAIQRAAKEMQIEGKR